jgi:hypothetical protein
LTMDQKRLCAAHWLQDRDDAIEHAIALEKIGVHKQVGNRLLEPWMWITVIVSATNFENLFALRCSKLAEPHFQELAYKTLAVYDASTPQQLKWGEWHLPLVTGYEEVSVLDVNDRFKLASEPDMIFVGKGLAEVSAGRCARVSYLTHEGKRSAGEDLSLCHRLANNKPMHASPLEHPAQAVDPYERATMMNHIGMGMPDWGNFEPGWLQLRKMYENEKVTQRKQWFVNGERICA